MVFVSIPNSETLTLNLDPKSTTVFSLQQSIEHHTQIPISHQHLLLPSIFQIKSINQASTLLSELNITPHSTLILIIRTNEDSWLQAANSQQFLDNKHLILSQAVQQIPDSVKLWRAVFMLINSKEPARQLLRRAVKNCPSHLEFWLALAKLEKYDWAKKVLKMAGKKLPKEPAIWIAAAKLEEANGNLSTVGEVIERGIKELQKEGVVIDREAWMKEAEAAERAGSVATSQAIVKSIVGMGMEELSLDCC